MITAAEFLSENYSAFYDDFTIQELKDIIQAMEEYKQLNLR